MQSPVINIENGALVPRSPSSPGLPRNSGPRILLFDHVEEGARPPTCVHPLGRLRLPGKVFVC